MHFPASPYKKVSASFSTFSGPVDQQRGCCEVSDGKYEITLYTSVAMLQKEFIIITHMKTIRSSAVDMHREDLESQKLDLLSGYSRRK